jgi:hypothetical protein
MSFISLVRGPAMVFCSEVGAGLPLAARGGRKRELVGSCCCCLCSFLKEPSAALVERTAQTHSAKASARSSARGFVMRG